MEVVVSIIATHGVKQRRRFAPVVFALAIYHREPKRRARRTKSLPQGSESTGFEGREALDLASPPAARPESAHTKLLRF